MAGGTATGAEGREAGLAAGTADAGAAGLALGAAAAGGEACCRVMLYTALGSSVPRVATASATAAFAGVAIDGAGELGACASVSTEELEVVLTPHHSPSPARTNTPATAAGQGLESLGAARPRGRTAAGPSCCGWALARGAPVVAIRPSSAKREAVLLAYSVSQPLSRAMSSNRPGEFSWPNSFLCATDRPF